MKRYFVGVLFFTWLALLAVGLSRHVGSPLVFIVFSLVSLLLLLDCFRRSVSVGYFFLVIFLTLGFWGKCVLHLLLNYKYLEPVGFFNDSPQAWDEVMWVSTVGLLGVGLGRVFFMQYENRYGSTNRSVIVPLVPAWYPPLRRWLWALTWVSIFGISLSNLVFDFAQSGLLPKIVLPWPMNGLIAWLLGFGLIVSVLVLTGWDHALGFSRIGYCAILVEGAMSGISSLSRATYIFHTLPALYIVIKKRPTYRRIVGIVVVWGTVFVASHAVVMGFRYSETSPIYASSNRSIETKDLGSYLMVLVEKSSKLIVDRWIGLEGVMAVVAYPQKSAELFKTALYERRVRGHVDLYTSEIARTGLTDNDMRNFQYATIPGGGWRFSITQVLFAGCWRG